MHPPSPLEWEPHHYHSEAGAHVTPGLFGGQRKDTLLSQHTIPNDNRVTSPPTGLDLPDFWKKEIKAITCVPFTQ
ncbi:hypothetical protein CDAR_207631 [Caerostris darwini]|uniref:Uncharacterized protein n=1 Tax=Caerostris darwini TaxID=1538125 RepID=A0AAV4WRD0_9ARAC|nr:hypothetical protein CDAR_207631 [Caerostris darwini]